jgi:hypothetical protein
LHENCVRRFGLSETSEDDSEVFFVALSIDLTLWKTKKRTGKWWVVMYARNRETESLYRTERTRITCTSHIGNVIAQTLTAPPPPSLPSTASTPDRTQTTTGGEQPGHKPVNGVWKVVLALGPLNDETEAERVCRLWSLSQKGVINKAARGEAISRTLDIQGFVDWSMVFGIPREDRDCHVSILVLRKNDAADDDDGDDVGPPEKSEDD